MMSSKLQFLKINPNACTSNYTNILLGNEKLALRISSIFFCLKSSH